MTERPIRDILAEAMRRERLGLIRPLWADWKAFGDTECEYVRKRADHLMRILAEFGVQLVQTGEPRLIGAPSPEIYRYWIEGNKAQRVIRQLPDGQWDMLIDEGGSETLEYRFTIAELFIAGGLVLTGADAQAKAVPGLGRKLAALSEICRVTAVPMERPA
jgi:hypothetical protein